MKFKNFFNQANTLFGRSFKVKDESKTEALERFIAETMHKKNLILEEIRSNNVTFSKQVKLEEELSICTLHIEEGKKILNRKRLKQERFSSIEG